NSVVGSPKICIGEPGRVRCEWPNLCVRKVGAGFSRCDWSNVAQFEAGLPQEILHQGSDPYSVEGFFDRQCSPSKRSFGLEIAAHCNSGISFLTPKTAAILHLSYPPDPEGYGNMTVRLCKTVDRGTGPRYR